MVPSRILGTMLLLSVLYGCSHPLEIWGTGDGDIDSLSGTRNCTLEQFEGEADNCAKNYILGAYGETYTAETRVGSLFHRWAGSCQFPDGINCSFNVSSQYVRAFWGQTMPPLQAIFRNVNNYGFNTLLIGGSFFDPFALTLQGRAYNAGFYSHNTTSFSETGEDGAPLALWNNPVLAAQIKAALDNRNIDLFGMTYHPTYSTPEGYQNWVNYALGKNPDTRIFIGTPWVSDPSSFTLADYETAYNAVQTGATQPILDTLRSEHPGVDFYEIPYGMAAVELRRLWEDGTLTTNGDVTALIGPAADAIFTDAYGHPGDILQELGTWLWLGAIYGVDSMYYDDESPFTTDLISIARTILERQDANYKAPPEAYPDTDDDRIANPYDPDDDNDGILDGDDACPLLQPNELGDGCPFSSTIIRASLSSSDEEGDMLSWKPEISDDGHYVVFLSQATNLVPGDTNDRPDVFVRDLQDGTTTRVSLDSSGNESVLGSSTVTTAVSANGRYVTFGSGGSDLVPDDTNNGIDAFLHDRVAGSTTRVSVDSAGNEGNHWSAYSDAPVVSDDGRYVVFTSRASNLVAGSVSPYDDVFMHDTQTGATTLISVSTGGAAGDGYSNEPDMSADGRYVVFDSSSKTFDVDDVNIYSEIFLRDTVNGTTTRINLSVSGTYANSSSVSPSISADGRYIVYQSAADNLVANDTNNMWDIFLFDRQTSVTTRVSVTSAGTQGIGGRAISGATSASISADGRYVSFAAGFTNLAPNSVYSVSHTYVHDTQTGATARVSTTRAGEPADTTSSSSALSGDGGLVVFQSTAANLVDDDTNTVTDVFVREVH
jgi:Tol biopolymer transport system component